MNKRQRLIDKIIKNNHKMLNIPVSDYTYKLMKKEFQHFSLEQFENISSVAKVLNKLIEGE